MALKSCKIVLSLSAISVQDGLVSGARAEHLTLPRNTTDSTIVTVEAANFLLFRDVPVLELASGGSYSEVITLV